MKSDILIKDDIYRIITGSELASAVNGAVYKAGVRPTHSNKEDILISVLSNDNGQIQKAVVNVNIYVFDERKSSGETQEATIRLRELCSIASKVLERGFGDDFRFELSSQRVLPLDGANMHVINNKLNYLQIND